MAHSGRPRRPTQRSHSKRNKKENEKRETGEENRRIYTYYDYDYEKKKKRKGNRWVGGRGGTNGKRDEERRRKEHGNI
jgi:hypothetical protein